VILKLNNEKIEGGNAVYSHKAIIETILNYNTDTKKTCLTSIGYDADEAVRKKWFKGSKKFAMCGSLQLDFFDQPKYLIPGVNVYLKLNKNTNNLLFKTTVANVSVEITEAKLYVRRVKVDPSVLIGHQIGLNKQNARYPVRNIQLVSHSIPVGSLSFFKEQLFSDTRLPKFVLITFQNSAQFIGDKTLDTSYYQHLNTTSITLSRNSDYRETYTQDFGSDSYIRSYVTSLIRNMGYLDKNLNVGITFDDFKSKYPFFTFILAADFDYNQVQLPKQGNLKLDVKFGKALTEPANLIIYGVFDHEIQINKNGTIFY
jgi:hypothetical protein